MPIKKSFIIRLAAFCLVVVLTGLTLAFIFFPLPGHIPVLMYHFIGPPDSADSNSSVITEAALQKQMSFLKRFGYRVITLEEFDATLSGTRKPLGKELVITFDDGNTSVADKAIPILNSFQFPVTLFLISQSLKTGVYGSMKEDKILELQKNPLVHWGSHTRTHPFLSQIPEADMKLEVQDSKKELENLLGVPIYYFAYPYGDFDERTLAAVRNAGYKRAFTTSPKKLRHFPLTDLSMTRVKITESDANLFSFWGKISGVYESFKIWRHKQVQKKS